MKKKTPDLSEWTDAGREESDLIQCEQKEHFYK